MKTLKRLFVKASAVFLIIILINQAADAQWVQTKGPGGGTVSAIVYNGTYLFAATGNGGYGSGVFRSSDNGTSWSILNTPTTSQSRDDKCVTSMATDGNVILAGGLSGRVFTSYDNGNTWTKSTISGTSNSVTCFAIMGNKYFAGTQGDGVFEHDSGSVGFGSDLWNSANNGLTDEYITSLVKHGSVLYAAGDYGPTKVFSSTDSGSTWNQLASLPSGVSNAHCLTMVGDSLYVGTNNGAYSSGDGGASWNGPIGGSSPQVEVLAGSGNKLFASNFDSIYSVSQTGGKWKAATKNFYATAMLPTPSGLLVGGDSLLANYGWGIYSSTDNGSTWNSQNIGLTGSTIEGFAESGDTLYALSPSQGLFSTTDKGETWKLLTSDAKAQDATLQTILVSIGKIFVRAATGFLTSTDGGKTWVPSTPGFTPQAFFAYGSKIFVGEQGGVQISTNNGGTWTQSNSGMTGYLSANCFAAIGDKLYVGLYSGGIYVSTDSGSTWTASSTGLSSQRIRSFATLGQNLYAGTDGGGVNISTDGGATWSASNSGLSSQNVWSLVAVDSILFVGSNDGVHISLDSSKTWTSTSPWPVITNTILASSSDLFAGTLANGVWRRSLGDFLTGVKTHSRSLLINFSLQQNYPNPFNPATTIRFTIQSTAVTSLKIYDVLGREIATLVNEVKSPGTYQVNFDAGKLASGIYIYQLRAGSSVETKRMVLMK
jgi:photosystem II stability/assembly factor-like uncharacterized protein